jgi:hypothetical protein
MPAKMKLGVPVGKGGGSVAKPRMVVFGLGEKFRVGPGSVVYGAFSLSLRLTK